MANLHNNNERRYQRYPMDKRYMVDTGELHDLSLYQGNAKPQREMITKVLIWLWYGIGIPCWVSALCSIVLGWIHLGDVKEFITLMIPVILGISKVVIMWAEKGDIVWAKCKRFFKKKRGARVR